jgi:hypothetical protein
MMQADSSPLGAISRIGAAISAAWRRHPLAAVFGGTYFTLRLLLVVVAFALPFYLWPIGDWVFGVDQQGSLSGYYTQGDLRDEFVAALCAMGAMLIVYRGFTWLEDVALDLAGVAAIIVALVPEGTSDLHGVAAVAFFIFGAYVVAFRSRDTVELIQDDALRWLMKVVYVAMAILMAASSLLVYFVVSENDPKHLTFWIEASGVLGFGVYWLVKTIELKRIDLDSLSEQAEITAEPVTWNRVFQPLIVDTTTRLPQRQSARDTKSGKSSQGSAAPTG